MTWNFFFVFICVHYNRRIALISRNNHNVRILLELLSPRVRLSFFCADLIDDTMRCLSVIFSSILTFLRFCKAGSALAMNWYISFREWSEAKFNLFESTDNWSSVSSLLDKFFTTFVLGLRNPSICRFLYLLIKRCFSCPSFLLNLFWVATD